jgi:riboflavin kinase/FMN adenylyltransferase
VRVISSVSSVQTPTVVALGNFDGVHRGHRKVIDPILSVGQAGQAQATVATFNPHPQEFFTGQTRQLLTPLDEKVEYLSSIGIEQLVLLPFNNQLACLTPEDFVEFILVRHLQAKWVSVGQNFRFGRQRSGSVDDLKAIASRFKMSVHVASLQVCNGDRVSSSAIRQALANGDLSQANQLLGRPYQIIGQVTLGQQLGRTLGFPTANLKIPTDKLLPRQGVYHVDVINHTGNHPIDSSNLIPGVMNIGYRPTVGGSQQMIEVHLLDWSGDLYDQTLAVHLKTFLRPEQKFATLEDLKAQIQIDCKMARALAGLSQPR